MNIKKKLTKLHTDTRNQIIVISEFKLKLLLTITHKQTTVPLVPLLIITNNIDCISST